MKKKPGFRMREVCGEKFLIAEGLQNIDFSKLISLNESSAYLWEAINEDEEFSVDSLTQLLLKEYEVEEEVARNDVEALVKSMLEAGVIE